MLNSTPGTPKRRVKVNKIVCKKLARSTSLLLKMGFQQESGEEGGEGRAGK